jgi:hypothetical protein
MKKLILIFSLTLALAAQDMSQIGAGDPKNVFEGGIGVATINGKTYTTFTLTPELTLGNFGMGFNLELMFDNDGGFEFRDDMYKNGAGWLRAIRYIRYGHKGDDIYARVGSIDNGILGNGFLMFHYTNASNYDERKMGLLFDYDFENFGFETVYSNFGRPEIFGLRGYYRPLTESDIPILNTLEVGATLVTDSYNKKVTGFTIGGDDILEDDAITAFGVDVGVMVLDYDYLKSKVYFDMGSISNYGSGSALGTSFIIPDVLSLFEFGIKYEMRWLGDEFAPNLFNTGYEALRASNGVTNYLKSISSTSGHFSELAMSVLKFITVRGNYSKIHGNPAGGVFYAEAIVPEMSSFEISATYSKVALDSFDDAFRADERAVAELNLGYQINTYLFFTTTYRHNWILVDDEDNGGTKLKAQKTVIPQVKFRFNF